MEAIMIYEIVSGGTIQIVKPESLNEFFVVPPDRGCERNMRQPLA